MPNRFFNNVINLLTGTKARAGDVEADFTAVSAGFDIVQTEMDAKAPLASPNFSGVPTAPTAPGGTNTQQLATCQFVLNQALSASLPSQTGNAGKALVTDGTTASWQSVTASWSTLSGKPTTFAGFGFSASQSRIDIGITTTGDAIVTAATQAAARTAIGASTVGSAIMVAADAAAVRTSAGAGATGDAVFTAANALAARTAIGITLGTAANNVVQLDGSGRLPAVDASQLLNVAGQQTGEIAWFARSTAPTGFVKANGATIGSASSGATSRANADTLALFTLLWTEFSNTILPIQDSAGAASTRGASAAADFAANKRMPVPDARGEFVRGWDDGRGVDSGRALGSSQLDQMQGHQHTSPWALSASDNGGGDPRNVASGVGPNTSSPVTDGTNGTPRVGAETRPRNIAFLACIKL